MNTEKNKITVDAEKKTIMGIAIGAGTISLFLYFFDAVPIMITAFLSLMLTSLLYAFLGGIKDAELKWKMGKIGGSLAGMAILGIFINPELEKYNPPISPIAPNPNSWIAVDSSGSFISVTIGKETYSKNVTEFLRNAEWGVEIDSTLIWITQGNRHLAQLDPMAIKQVGFFDSIKMSPGKGIQYTEQLTVGAEANLTPTYPFTIRATQFKDEYNEFQILNENNEIILERGLLRTKNFRAFEYDEKHYLIFVVRANHIDTERGPWSVFGLTQITRTLSIAQ